MSQLALDFTAARTRRDIGMARAERSAGEIWKERALGYVLEWCATHSGAWLTEDARAYAEKHGLESPPTKKAWGPVMQEALRRGIVRFDGYAPANSSNGSPKCRWVRA